MSKRIFLEICKKPIPASSRETILKSLTMSFFVTLLLLLIATPIYKIGYTIPFANTIKLMSTGSVSALFSVYLLGYGIRVSSQNSKIASLTYGMMALFEALMSGLVGSLFAAGVIVLIFEHHPQILIKTILTMPCLLLAYWLFYKFFPWFANECSMRERRYILAPIFLVPALVILFYTTA